jgi:DNA-binding CsgD family transcriptional regulator
MLIVDRKVAVIPADHGDSSAGAMVVRSTGILAALCQLFDSVWSRAAPLLDDGPKKSDSRGLTSSESEVLRMLTQGHTDETIAKRLGVSSRTARRIAADLMGKLDARSRFQAGAQAALYGWISPDSIGVPGLLTGSEEVPGDATGGSGLLTG